MIVKKLNLKGQALVEFVMVIPVIVFLLFSSFDFLKIVYYFYKPKKHSEQTNPYGYKVDL